MKAKPPPPFPLEHLGSGLRVRVEVLADISNIIRRGHLLECPSGMANCLIVAGMARLPGAPTFPPPFTVVAFVDDVEPESKPHVVPPAHPVSARPGKRL